MKLFQCYKAICDTVAEANKDNDAAMWEKIVGVSIYQDKDRTPIYSVFYENGQEVLAKLNPDDTVSLIDVVKSTREPQLKINYKQLYYLTKNIDNIELDNTGKNAYAKIKLLSKPKKEQAECYERRIKDLYQFSFGERERFLVELYEYSKDYDVIRNIYLISRNTRLLSSGNEMVDSLVDSLDEKTKCLIYNLIKYGNTSEKYEENVNDKSVKNLLDNYINKMNGSGIAGSGLYNLAVAFDNFSLPKDLKGRYEVFKNKEKEMRCEFLAYNNLMLINKEFLTDGEMKKLFDVEKNENLFSASANTDSKNHRTFIDVTNDNKSGFGTHTKLKSHPNSENLIFLYSGRADKTDHPEIGQTDKLRPIGERNNEETLVHELGHFRLNQIMSWAAKIIYSQVEPTEDQMIGLYGVLNARVKSYLKNKAVEFYNNANKLIGLDNKKGAKARVYTNYKSSDDNIEIFLLGYSEYSKYCSVEFVGETHVIQNFANRALKDLYNQCFELDFGKLTPETALDFFKKIGFKDIKHIKDDVSLYLEKNKCLKRIKDSKKLVDEVMIQEDRFEKKIIEDSKDSKEFFCKIATYQIYLKMLNEVCKKNMYKAEDDKVIKQRVREELNKFYDNYNWDELYDKKGELICNVEEIKKHTKVIIDKYYDRLASASGLNDRFNAFYHIMNNEKEIHLYEFFRLLASDNNLALSYYENLKYTGSALPKELEYKLISKFAETTPRFNALIEKLTSAKSENEIKNALKTELKDEFDAWIFFRAIGKDIGKYKSPFDDIKKTITESGGLFSDSQKRLNKLINGIKINESDIEKCKVLKDKDFSKLFEDYKRNSFDLNRINENGFDVENKLTSNTNKTKKKIKFIDLRQNGSSRKNSEDRENNGGEKLYNRKRDLLNQKNKSNNNGNHNSSFQIVPGEIQNLIRMKVLLNSIEKIRYFDEKKSRDDLHILVPTGPLSVIWSGETIGFPNVIMKGRDGRACYISNKGFSLFGQTTEWRELGKTNFDTLLQEKVARDDGRRAERRLDRGKIESRHGVGLIELRGANEINDFRERLENTIKGSINFLKVMKEHVDNREGENLSPDINKIANCEQRWEQVGDRDPNNLLTELRRDIDYKNLSTEGDRKPFIDYTNLNKLISHFGEKNDVITLNINRMGMNVELNNNGSQIRSNFRRVAVKNKNAYTPTCKSC